MHSGSPSTIPCTCPSGSGECNLDTTHQGNEILPVLVEAASNHEGGIARTEAIKILGEIGPDAREVLPP